MSSDNGDGGLTGSGGGDGRFKRRAGGSCNAVDMVPSLDSGGRPTASSRAVPLTTCADCLTLSRQRARSRFRVSLIIWGHPQLGGCGEFLKAPTRGSPGVGSPPAIAGWVAPPWMPARSRTCGAISSESVRLFPVATEVQRIGSDGYFDIVLTRPSHTCAVSARARAAVRGGEPTSVGSLPS